jgi:hypothetical protein
MFQLIAKRHAPVVFFLALDVVDQPVFVMRRMGECPVSVLPIGEIEENVVLFDPI